MKINVKQLFLNDFLKAVIGAVNFYIWAC